MSTNTVKFKVFSEGYEKLNTTHPSGISYTLGFCLPIYDLNFDPNNTANGGTWHDVSDPAFVSEDGMTNLGWFSQYESVVGGVLSSFSGEQLYLYGSFDSQNRYARADGYVLDGDLLNITGNLPAQKTINNLVTTDFWKVYPYTPLNAQATSGSVSVGSYEATIPGDAGDFTFNKLAVFLKELDANGNETGNFHFFGMIYSNLKLIKRYNNDPEAYNPAFKIKLNVVVSDLTTSNPYDDYVFINSGYWNLLSSDIISTLYHTVSGRGVSDYDFAYRLASETHFKLSTDAFGTSQESMTEPDSVGGNRLMSLVRKPKWFPITVGAGSETLEVRYFLYDFKILDPDNQELLLGDRFASVVYGREGQVIETDKSFVFDTTDDQLPQLLNTITSRARFQGVANGGGNVIFSRGIYANAINSFIMEQGGYGEEFQSIFFVDNSKIFGKRNRVGFQTGEFTATFSKYADVFGEDHYVYGDFAKSSGQCNIINKSFTYVDGVKNEIGLNNGAVQNYFNMFKRGEAHTRIENVGVHVYGDSNFINSLNSWNSGLDIRLGGGYTSIWGNVAWEAYREATLTDVAVFGSFNNVMGTLRNVLLSMSNSFIRGGLNDVGLTEPADDNNTLRDSVLVGSHSTVGRTSNSIVNTNNKSITNANGLSGIVSRKSKVIGTHSLVNVSNESHVTSVFSMASIHANNIGGGFPTVWTRRESYYYNTPSDVRVNDHQWSSTLLNERGDNDNAGYYGHYYNETTPTTIGLLPFMFEWWSIIGKAVVSGTPNSTYDRDVCTIYHLGGGENFEATTTDPETIGGYANIVYIRKDGVQADHLFTNFENGNHWYAYVPVKNKIAFLVKIETIEVIGTAPDELLKITYSNPINRSTVRNSNTEKVEGVNHIYYATNSFDKLSTNLCAFVEVEDAFLETFLASNDLELFDEISGVPALPDTDASYITNSMSAYIDNSIAQAGPTNKIRRVSGSMVVGSGLVAPGELNRSSVIGSGELFANFHGLDYIGENNKWEFKLETDTQARYYYGYDGSDLTGASEFRKYHIYVPNGNKDSYFEFIRGRDIRIRQSKNGYGAFNFYYGSKIDVGIDLVNDMVGSTGQMYNFVFGHNITIASDSGLYGSSEIGKKYANINMVAMGINLMLSRSDQFVFGRNNVGDPRNLFEFGIGLHYEDPNTNSKQNGFAFGYIYDGYELLGEEGYEAHAKFPAFKVETGYLYMGKEDLGIVCKEFKAFVPDASRYINIGDLITAYASGEDETGFETNGSDIVTLKSANADLDKMRVIKHGSTVDNWEEAGFVNKVIGVALSSQTVDGGMVLVGIKGGPFPVTKNHTTYPSAIPPNMTIISKKNAYPLAGWTQFQVYLR